MKPKVKQYLLDKAMRFAEESIKEDYSHIRDKVFDFEWFKSNMRGVLDEFKKELEECIRDIVNKDFSENEYLAKVEQYTVLEVKYNELIMAVGNKYKAEIRKKINQPQDKERRGL